MRENYKKEVVGITGASGFIGKNLSQHLELCGFKVISLKRGFSVDELQKCNIIINLAGSTINKRWSKSYKKKILESRLNTTKKITSYIKENNNISLLINASAVGIYSAESKLFNDEYNNLLGNDFLATVCKEWEKEALSVKEECRVAIIRLGVVLSKKGGALPKMTLPARFGIATILGDGNQIISWVMLEDLLRAIDYIIESNLKDIINICAPNPITNRELTKEIAKHYNSLFTIRIPAFFIKLILGSSSSVILKGQYVVSKKLKESNFRFRKPFFTKLF